MRFGGFLWVAVSVLVCISTVADAFQARFTVLNHVFNSQKWKLRARTRPAVNDIFMAKGFGSATDKKKPVTDAMSKANNPAIPPIPIVKHELPAGSQFMGTFLHHILIPAHYGIVISIQLYPSQKWIFNFHELCADAGGWIIQDESVRVPPHSSIQNKLHALNPRPASHRSSTI